MFNKAVAGAFNDSLSTFGSLDLLTDRDREQIFSWNHKLPQTVNACLHEIIEEQSARQPDRPAICGWDADFTYRELDDIASRLALHLHGLGVGPETMVPLCFEKSSWTIVAMLAVNKTGGAFVPLDPSYPDIALTNRIKDVGAKILLTSAKFHDRFAEVLEKVFIVSGDTIRYLPTVASKIVSGVTPKNLAYVMFTSGSTGKPKAVALEHAAVSTSIAHHGPAMGFNSNSRTLQFSSYTFDACILDIFTTLFLGGCVCVPSEAERTGNIAGAINRMGVNISFLTPSVVQLIGPNDVPSLKTLSLGGEPVGDDHIRVWGNKLHLMNGFGPTECSIFCVMGPLSWPRQYRNSIGRAVGSLSWIVDREDHNRLVPVGCVGELLIHGAILARGYLGDEEKTKLSFITNPPWLPLTFGGSPQRLYKTGDLVRYNADGIISYVGRKDTQVKIRGQRIELGEIEQILANQGLVEHSMVLAPKDGPCKQRLVAVLTLKEHARTGGKRSELQVVSKSQRQAMADRLSKLRDGLESQLPKYMVPSVWVLLEAIPFNTAGKIDRSKISQWTEHMSEEVYDDIMGLNLETLSIEHATEIEKRLQAIWAHVLNVPAGKINLDRSFFSLGGDSITAMQIVSACRAEKINIHVQDILQSKTVSQLALRATVSEKTFFTRNEEFDVPFDPSPIQQLYFDQVVPHDTDEPNGHHFNQSFFLHLTRPVDPENVSRAVQNIVLHHSMLRARFHQDQRGHWTQLVLRDTAPGVYRFNVHKVADRAQSVSIAQASQKSLNIKDGPVFAVDMFTQNDDQFIFLVAHHLVVDLVSWRIILQDLELYLETGALCLEKPVPFHTWCELQAKHTLQEAELQAVLSIDVTPIDWVYWGITSDGNVQADRVEKYFCLDPASMTILLGEGNDAFHTEPSEIILSALFHSFNHIFVHRSSPTFFIEDHGRKPWDPAIDLSRTVGWFTTMSPLNVPRNDSRDVLDTLKQTKDILRRISGNHHSYFASRFLGSSGIDKFNGHGQMEVLFNYTGRQQQLEREDALFQLEPVTADLVLSDIGKNMKRLALFEIDVTVANDIVKVSFAYNRYMKHQDLIQAWIRASQATLEEILQKIKITSVEYTLSDFPLLGMTKEGLETLEGDRIRKIGLSSFEEIEDIYPCSPMQQGILLSQVRLPGLYEVQQVSKIVLHESLDVDVERIKSAWQRVVDRHPLLRTVFIKSVSPNGIFDQVVLKKHDAVTLHLKCQNQDEAMEILKSQSSLNYNETRPPHRLTLCEALSGEIFCKIEISHALIDGMSVSIIARDLALAYDEMLPAGNGPLYSNYISYLQQQPTEAAIQYWMSYLADIRPCLLPRLPGKKGNPADNKSIKVDLEVRSLYEFSERNGVTFANIFQAAWGLVLRTYTSSDQVCFGYLVSGRDIPIDGIENAVGAFINMVICRLDITSSTEVATLVQKVQQEFLQSIPYQHCSLAEIQHELGLGGKTLFNSAISLQRVEPDNNGSSISLSRIFDQDPTEVNKKQR